MYVAHIFLTLTPFIFAKVNEPHTTRNASNLHKTEVKLFSSKQTAYVLTIMFLQYIILLVALLLVASFVAANAEDTESRGVKGLMPGYDRIRALNRIRALKKMKSDKSSTKSPTSMMCGRTGDSCKTPTSKMGKKTGCCEGWVCSPGKTIHNAQGETSLPHCVLQPVR